MQMALAAGFALLKLLNSDFASKLPADKGRQFVLQTVDALRKSKVWSNDLLDRFAEVLAQLWKESSRGRSLHSLSQSPSLSNSGMNSMFNHHNQQQHQQQSQRRGSIRLRMALARGAGQRCCGTTRKYGYDEPHQPRLI
jgi:transcriptional regulatory protein LEU3